MMKLIQYILIIFFLLVTYSAAYAQLDLDFETDRGFYDTPFNLELTVNDPAAIVRYTTNGTAPTTTTGILYTNPIPINTTSHIRAIAYTGTDTTRVLTHSYIFLDDVVNQPDAVSGFPTSGFEFDASIKNNATYSAQLMDALTQVGSISIVMDLPQLDSVHNETVSAGEGYEMPASVELLYPDGESHQQNCGIERFGGSSFNSPKRNFRLSFKSIYGKSKLEYPMFGKEVENEFDQIALRAGHAGCINREGTSLHTGESNDIADQVVRDLQIDVQPDGIGVAGNFMHLYINGIYWGVYNATERPAAGWAKKYYGGSKDDWDVIKTKAVLAGNATAWNTLNSIADNQDLSIPANYNLIQDYIDVEQFIDYVIVTNYAPHSDNHVNGKNSYLNINRNDNTGFKFWIWDSEPALDYYWTRLWAKDHVGHRAYDNIFNSLLNNSDFRTKVNDRMECHCFNDGALTPNNAIDAYMDVYNSTDIAMIAEAARWATSAGYQGFVDAKNRVTGSYMPVRTNETISNYRNAGLYPNINAVQFSQYGGEVASGYQLTLSNPNGAGTIYYTTDGTDPRASGGGISGSAQVYSAGISLPDGATEIKARVLSGATWSAMCPRRFYTNVDYSGLVINEIMYHADDTCSAFFDELDYIEIYNKGTKTVDLADTKFSCGIDYVFEFGVQIAPGDYLVLAENKDTFNLHYGFMPDGEYKGGLDNGGETLLYYDFAENLIDSVKYNDKNPWDEAPDGKGPSLELRDPSLDNADPLNWFRSDNLCGSPGQPNGRLCANVATPIVINEINYNPVTVPNTGDWVELYNPNASAVNISNWEFYDNENKYVIPSGTTLQPDEYLILAEDVALFSAAFPHLNVGQYIGNLGFNLSNGGERISLFDTNKCLSDYVIYNDKSPWDTIPDGNGPSLSLITPNSDNTLPQSWEASSNINSAFGTPGRANEPCLDNIIEFPNTICAGFPAEIKVDSAYSNMTFTWFASGATPPSFTVDSEVLTWNNPGTYNLQLITKHFECTRVYTQSITVEDCNTIPNIIDDNFVTNEDNVLSDNVLNNDNDPDNDNLIVNTTPQTNVSNGTLTLNTDGTFDYTPNPNFYGTDSFIYEVCDDATVGSTTTTPGSFTGEVTSSTDDVEELLDGTIETTSSDLDMMEDSPDFYAAMGIRMTGVAVPQNATVTGAYLEFVADESQSVATSLTISAEATGNAATIPTTANALTSKTKTTAAVSWANLPAWTTGNTYQSTDISPVIQELINRGDWASGNAMTLIIEGTGRRTAESFDGTAPPKLVINYEVISSGGQVDVSLCDTAVVTINITPQNDTPIANDDALSTSEENPITGNVIINDEDIENAAGTCGVATTQIVSFGGSQDQGTFTIIDNQSVLIENNAWKAIPFNYTVTPNTVLEFDFKSTEEGELHNIGMDDNLSQNAEFRFKIYGIHTDNNSINDFDIYDGSGEYMHFSIPIGQYYTGTKNYLFFNSDNDANPSLGNTFLSNICVYEDTNGNGVNDETNLTVNTTPVTAPANGTVTIDNAGIYTYTPNVDFFGTDSFTYEICDDGNPVLCDMASVTIDVAPVNDAPLAQIDIYQIQEDAVISGDVLANDNDIENHTLTVTTTPVSNISNGILTLNANGTFIYTPNANFSGFDSFSYEVCDNGTPSECSTTTVNINIIGENDAPIATDDTASTMEDMPFNGDIATNDSDIEGDNLTVNTNPVSDVSNGILTLNSDGTYSYLPNANFFGTDSFTYEICDDGNPVLCDTASVTIDIIPVNDAPIPAPDTLYMLANSTIQDNVLLNDSDIENDNLTAMINPMANPINGTAIIQPNGNIDYTPNPNFIGTDSFTYEVCDDGTPTLCNTETVVIIIEPDCVDIELAAWLEGAYDPALGEMRNTLVTTRKLLPGQTPASNLATPTPPGQPYSTAPWNYTGTEGATWTDADYTGDETDWILVSFRTGIAKNTEVGMTAALLMKDGSITFPNRCALTSNVASPLYIVAEHRNHIGIMTPQPVDVIGSTLTYDFRLADSYRDPTSFGQKQLPTGEWVMFAGDANQSDFPSFDINGTDKTLWFDNNGVFDYYFSPDFNLDGDINGQDKSLWFDNNGISSRVPK